MVLIYNINHNYMLLFLYNDITHQKKIPFKLLKNSWSFISVCQGHYPYFCVLTQSCLTLCYLKSRRAPTRLLCPWNFQGKNTGVGCHFLFQRIFLTQGLSLRLLHWHVLPCTTWESLIFNIISLKLKQHFISFNTIK